MSTSIGISIYPEDGGTMDALFKNADIAMYNPDSILTPSGSTRYHEIDPIETSPGSRGSPIVYRAGNR